MRCNLAILGADVTIRDRNSSTCLHMALCDHTTIDFSSFPKLRKSTPQDLDESPSIAKVRSALYCVCCLVCGLLLNSGFAQVWGKVSEFCWSVKVEESLGKLIFTKSRKSCAK